MKAIILSGGRGNRLRPITDYAPKPLIPINNKPIIEWQIKYLKNFGINDIIIGSTCGAVEKAPLTLSIYPGLNGWRCASTG